MAQFGETFDATTVEPKGSADPLPNGKYVMAIIDSEWKTTKAGTGNMLKLELEVVDGEHKGRKCWDQLNLNNPNPQAVEIAQRTLSSICHATGQFQVKDSTQLHNIPMLVKLVVKQDGEYEPRNEVKAYAAVGGALLASPSTPKASRPTPGQPPIAPWAKAKAEAA
jgi:hypothetical protein